MSIAWAARSCAFRCATPAPILHLTLFNPLDDHYGMSPLEAAQASLDVHNAASAWNKALLDNAARPSGALVYSAARGNLSDEQFERLKRELEAHYQGAANAGRPLLLEGGLDWKGLSLSPKDMDFVEAKHIAAREIALAFGVPPMLLGIPGDNTYSNYAEANRTLYRQTVLPLLSRIASALGHWLGESFGGNIRLTPDLDEVPALSIEREALWKRVGEAGFSPTTRNVQRRATSRCRLRRFRNCSRNTIPTSRACRRETPTVGSGRMGEGVKGALGQVVMKLVTAK